MKISELVAQFRPARMLTTFSARTRRASLWSMYPIWWFSIIMGAEPLQKHGSFCEITSLDPDLCLSKHLFKCPSLCLQAKWDLRDAIKEVFSRKNLFMPEYVSYIDKLACYAWGAALYLYAIMKNGQQEVRP